jgi:PAS domain S-box-containing protein
MHLQTGGETVLKRKVQLAFGSAIVILLAVGAVSYSGVVQSSESDRWVRHTHEVLENLQNLVADMESIESSDRGFALTGDQSYIESYHTGAVSAARDEKAIRDLTVDNPQQQRQLPALENLIARNIQLGDKVIGLRQAKGLEAGADLMRDESGKKVMNEFRGKVREMHEEELQLLQVRKEEAKQRLDWTKIVLMFGTALSLSMAATAGWSMQRRDNYGRELAHALAASERALKELADQKFALDQHAIVATTDVRGTITYVNDKFCAISKYSKEELIDQNHRILNSGHHPKEFFQQMYHTIANGQVWRGEICNRAKDGSIYWVDTTIVPLAGEDGKPHQYVAIRADITERRQAADALALQAEELAHSRQALETQKIMLQSETRYRGLLEAAPDAIVVVNSSGEIVLLNVRAEKQFGYSRNELVGQQIKSIIPEGFAERLIADGTRSATDALAQQIGSGIELIARRKDGSEFPIEIMLSPLESAGGILVTAAIRDITERRKSQEHLVKTMWELKRSNDELQQFAYVSSHDLQEPLRMVSSYTQLLAKRYHGHLDSDAHEFIAFAVDGCNRMQGLIQDLLAYSRAGTNGKELSEVSSENALQKALTNLRITIEQSGSIVTHDSLPVVTTDATQLTQIFQNLVGNAIKYHGAEAPRVHVSATRNGGNEWTFSVRDNGLGIDPQYFERIFILFQRLHGRDEFEGTGIGLAICKKILERLGGRIWVESQPEKGSTFYFALPEIEGK